MSMHDNLRRRSTMRGVLLGVVEGPQQRLRLSLFSPVSVAAFSRGTWH